MSKETTTRLYEKMEAEQQHYREWLLSQPPNEILNHTYEYTMRQAVKDKYLISRAAEKFGSQCVVVAIDAKLTDDGYHVFIHGGRTDTGIDAIEWAKEVEALGCGEILLTSMDADGTKAGFDIPLTDIISKTVNRFTFTLTAPIRSIPV